MRRRLHAELMTLGALVLLLAACGVAWQEEGDYVCEPEADSEWAVSATPKSGNCPEEWVEWGRTEILERTFVYQQEDLECGTNDLTRSVTQNRCDVSVDEEIHVFDGELGSGYVTLDIECDNGSGCSQGYNVDYSRGSGPASDCEERGTCNDCEELGTCNDCEELGTCNDSDPEPACSEAAFRNRFMERTFSDYYYAGSGGALECEDGAVCFHEQYVFFPDGTYSHVHSNMGELGDIDSGVHRICVNGEWSVSCDTITLSDCRRSETFPLRVEGDAFWIGAKGFEEAGIYIDPVSNCSTAPCR